MDSHINLFTEEVAAFAPKTRVKSMMFIPSTLATNDHYKAIHNNSGILVTGYSECHTINLAPENCDFESIKHLYYAGSVYKFEWVNDCIQAGKLLDKENSQYKITEIVGEYYKND